jgi:hypothetical protein
MTQVVFLVGRPDARSDARFSDRPFSPAKALSKGQPKQSSPEQICLAVGGTNPLRGFALGKSALRCGFMLELAARQAGETRTQRPGRG